MGPGGEAVDVAPCAGQLRAGAREHQQGRGVRGEAAADAQGGDVQADHHLQAQAER